MILYTGARRALAQPSFWDSFAQSDTFNLSRSCISHADDQMVPSSAHLDQGIFWQTSNFDGRSCGLVLAHMLGIDVVEVDEMVHVLQEGCWWFSARSNPDSKQSVPVTLTTSVRPTPEAARTAASTQISHIQ